MNTFEKKDFDKKEIEHIDPLYDLDQGLEPLIERVGNAKIVMLGEASHGTHEYYVRRARISKRLIEEKGFNIIGVEGDWPDCYRINRYIRNYKSDDHSSFDVLKKFNRWPSWMWANYEIAAFMNWLKSYNEGKGFSRQVGFYGLDVYSLWESLEAIINYLEKHDPHALDSAIKAMQCFEPFDREGQDYASFTRIAPKTCEQEVLNLLMKIRERVPMYDSDPEAPFSTEQNARTAVNAEKYYRAMIQGGPDSWNIRDTHMAHTLENLLDFHGSQSKAIIWAHNTHIGDARATGMHRAGMVNIGQLARDRWGNSATVLVGFGSHHGSVIAGRSWGAPMQEMEVPAARDGSWEAILHSERPTDKLVISEEIQEHPLMSKTLNHRAIGVVYHPEREKSGNYVPSLISQRYDAFVFLDKTQALHPIKIETDKHLTPETYPFGI